MRCHLQSSVLCVLLSSVIACGSEVASEALRTKFGNDLWSKDCHLVIAEIKSTRVSREPEDAFSKVQFRATVIDDSRAVLQGRDIQIVGTTLRYLSGGRSDSIDPYETGKVIVVLIKQHDDSYHVVAHGSLPIGIAYPAVVPREAIESLRRAIKLMYRFSETPTDATSDAKAQTLPRGKQYYEWALSASSLATNGTAEDRRQLVDIVWHKDVTLDQIVWMEYLVDSVFPPAERPNIAKRHHNLLSYLKRMRHGMPVEP